MFEIETFTAHAHYGEDRIRLDAISPEGAITSIWLTRRLCDRFVPMLVQTVAARVRPGVPSDIALAMAQQQLRQQREEQPTPDVVAPEGSPSWLCLTIHIEERGDHLVLTFTDDGDRIAAMVLFGDAPRSVLEVLLLMYRQLEWDLAPFPDWLTEAGPTGQEPRLLN